MRIYQDVRMCYTYKRVDDEMPLIRLPNSVVGGVPQGTIQIWAGTLITIPSGWALCDGLSGRPNLLDRFVRGVNTSVTNPGAIGGLSVVSLIEAQMPSHNHTLVGGGNHNHTIPLGTSNGTTGVRTGTVGNQNSLDLGDEDAPIVSGSGFTNNTGGGLSHDNIPPFFEVAYIIKESF